MPTLSTSMNGCRRASCSMADFLVGQSVVAKVAVSVVVIPLRSLRIAAAISDFDDDESDLSQRDSFVSRRERLGHALGLRAGINERDDRILLLGDRNRTACTSRRKDP